MKNEEDCLFCKIISGTIPSRKIYETENILAFLDISPFSEGHTVVITKKHYYNLLDIPDDEIKLFFVDLKKVASYLKDKLSIDGFNILQNNFPAGGQIVPHFHYHILPRVKGKQIYKVFKDDTLSSDEALDEVLNRIKN